MGWDAYLSRSSDEGDLTQEDRTVLAALECLDISGKCLDYTEPQIGHNRDEMKLFLGTDEDGFYSAERIKVTLRDRLPSYCHDMSRSDRDFLAFLRIISHRGIGLIVTS